MQDQTHNDIPFRNLNVIDEYTRECLAVRVARRQTQKDVLEVLTDLNCEKGVPVYIRYENGYEFTPKQVRHWLARLSVIPLFIGKMSDEYLAREIFYSIKDAQDLIEMRNRHYNTTRPHSLLGYQPPAPAAFTHQPINFQASIL